MNEVIEPYNKYPEKTMKCSQEMIKDFLTLVIDISRCENNFGMHDIQNYVNLAYNCNFCGYHNFEKTILRAQECYTAQFEEIEEEIKQNTINPWLKIGENG